MLKWLLEIGANIEQTDAIRPIPPSNLELVE
jgi:hypothetical protein